MYTVRWKVKLNSYKYSCILLITYLYHIFNNYVIIFDDLKRLCNQNHKQIKSTLTNSQHSLINQREKKIKHFVRKQNNIYTKISIKLLSYYFVLPTPKASFFFKTSSNVKVSHPIPHHRLHPSYQHNRPTTSTSHVTFLTPFLIAEKVR